MPPKIKVSKDGPYLVSGNLPLDKQIIMGDETGIPAKYQQGEKYPDHENCSLFRCGATKKQPFCDGSHVAVKFDGTETSGNKPYMKMAETTHGPNLDLTDAEELCALARFCDRGETVWTLTEKSDKPANKKLAIEEACQCPAGRLVAWEKMSGKPIEPAFPPSLSVIEDAALKVSGPLWVKGNVPIEGADGTCYEVRNRVTLCRCGRSENKPFCDGSHTEIEFDDGDSAINGHKHKK